MRKKNTFQKYILNHQCDSQFTKSSEFIKTKNTISIILIPISYLLLLASKNHKLKENSFTNSPII